MVVGAHCCFECYFLFVRTVLTCYQLSGLLVPSVVLTTIQTAIIWGAVTHTLKTTVFKQLWDLLACVEANR